MLLAWMFSVVAARIGNASVIATGLVLLGATWVGAAREDVPSALLGLNAILPFFAGVAASHSWRGRVLGARTLLLCAIVGIALDALLPLPWEGTSVEYGNIESVTSKSWRFGDADRLAGFARSSTLAGLQVLAFLAVVLPRLGLAKQVAVGAAAAWAIYLTTSRAAAGGLLVVLAVHALHRYALVNVAQPAFAILLALGIAAPLAAGVVDVEADVIAPGQQQFFTSTVMRFADSWPNAIDALLRADFSVLGLGTSSSYASQALLGKEPLVVDNVYLYVVVLAGLPGLVFLLSLVRFSRVGWHPDRSEVLLALAFAAAGVTNNVLESGTFAFLTGAALAFYRTRSLPHPHPSAPQPGARHALKPRPT